MVGNELIVIDQNKMESRAVVRLWDKKKCGAPLMNKSLQFNQIMPLPLNF